jgi:hypothetical protein
MKFEEVLPALRAGKKIKIENRTGNFHKDISRGCELSIDLILSNNWEIVKEKVKKTVWVNVFRGENMLYVTGVYGTKVVAEADTLSDINYLGAHPITVEVDEE